MATTNMGRKTRGVWAKRLAAVVAIAALGLTACTADGEKESSGQGSDSGASSDAGGASDGGGIDGGGNEEPDEFAMPTENEALQPPDPANYPGMELQNDEGAKQATRFFIDALYYGHATGDTVPLESVSTTDCTVCSEAINKIHERTQTEESFIVGYAIEIQELYLVTPDEAGLTTVYYAFYEGPTERRFKDRPSESHEGRNMHAFADLKFQDEGWRIVDAGWGMVDNES
ncbi:MAG: DUF6318 family protein [Dermabacter sp.]|nr:DUF6318 family protein [Dermabacter sp.]